MNRQTLPPIAALTLAAGFAVALLGCGRPSPDAAGHHLSGSCEGVGSGNGDSTFTISAPAAVAGQTIPGGGFVTWSSLGVTSISGAFATGEQDGADRPRDCTTTTTTEAPTTTTEATTTTVAETTTTITKLVENVCRDGQVVQIPVGTRLPGDTDPPCLEETTTTATTPETSPTVPETVPTTPGPTSTAPAPTTAAPAPPTAPPAPTTTAAVPGLPATR